VTNAVLVADPEAKQAVAMIAAMTRAVSSSELKSVYLDRDRVLAFYLGAGVSHETFVFREHLPERRSLDSYSDAEIDALYAPTADEDRALAAMGLSAWAKRLK